MRSRKIQHVIADQSQRDLVYRMFDALRNDIMEKRDGVIAEIRSYPPPIPACNKNVYWNRDR